MEFKEIRFEIDCGIATLTLDRADIRNAITGTELIEEIKMACDAVNADKEVKVLIITGAGPAFSAGGNIKDMAAKKGMFAGSPSQVMRNYKRNVQQIPLAVHNLEIPTIAAVNGPAIGAGLDLALMCDMRVASTKAMFGETFVNVGLIPGDGGAYFLPRLVGMAKACELTFTADVLDAMTAFDLGMVNYVVEPELLMEKTREIAKKIAAKPTDALRMAKRLLWMSQTAPLQHVLEQSAAFQALCHSAKDHTEALSAMFEKRKPQFKGE